MSKEKYSVVETENAYYIADNEEDAEIIIDYDSVKKRDDSVSCSIKE